MVTLASLPRVCPCYLRLGAGCCGCIWPDHPSLNLDLLFELPPFWRFFRLSSSACLLLRCLLLLHVTAFKNGNFLSVHETGGTPLKLDGFILRLLLRHLCSTPTCLLGFQSLNDILRTSTECHRCFLLVSRGDYAAFKVGSENGELIPSADRILLKRCQVLSGMKWCGRKYETPALKQQRFASPSGKIECS